MRKEEEERLSAECAESVLERERFLTCYCRELNFAVVVAAVMVVV